MFVEALDQLDHGKVSGSTPPKRKMTPAEWREFKKAHNGTH